MHGSPAFAFWSVFRKRSQYGVGSKVALPIRTSQGGLMDRPGEVTRCNLDGTWDMSCSDGGGDFMSVMGSELLSGNNSDGKPRVRLADVPTDIVAGSEWMRGPIHVAPDGSHWQLEMQGSDHQGLRLALKAVGMRDGWRKKAKFSLSLLGLCSDHARALRCATFVCSAFFWGRPQAPTTTCIAIALKPKISASSRIVTGADICCWRSRSGDGALASFAIHGMCCVLDDTCTVG